MSTIEAILVSTELGHASKTKWRQNLLEMSWKICHDRARLTLTNVQKSYKSILARSCKILVRILQDLV